MKRYSINSHLVIFILAVLLFFKPFIFQAKLPVSTDTIVGMYHPFRDLYAKEYPRGIPFKNSGVTDPIRQQYPWKNLAIEILKKGELPLWNPYTFSGAPLLANMQSGVFYPLNVLFLIFPFYFSWSLYILLQPLLAGLFLFLFLSELKLDKRAVFLGSLAFAFSGFMISWLEWGNVMHTGLWLPLILLSINKITNVKPKKLSIKDPSIFWSLIFLFATTSSFFAGHLQTFFYISIVSFLYFLFKWWQAGKRKSSLLLLIISGILFILVTAVQWIPALQFILLSGRNIDQADWRNPAWFLPYQNLVQFIVPDFFGNPATLNYWGVWNYGEFIGYLGILPLIMGLFALFFRRDKNTLFFGILLFLSLVFALPTIFAKVPYKFGFPFISTSQPTRLMFIADFSLSVLAALGLDLFLKNKKKIIFPLIFLTLVMGCLWTFVKFNKTFPVQDLAVTQQNMILPTLLFFAFSFLLLFSVFYKRKGKLLTAIPYILILITIFDLFRFGWKYTPFASKEYLYPNTSALSFLQKQDGLFRVMSTDSRIFPPNFSSIYHIQTLDGYDPLYLYRYAELMASSEREKPDISPPFGFNRIITPQHVSSRIIDLLGVRYVMAFGELSDPKLKKVLSEGDTKIYENKNSFPRAFFVKEAVSASNKYEIINKLFDPSIDLKKTAFVENWKKNEFFGEGQVSIDEYSENHIYLRTRNDGKGFLVITDTFYPTWRASICDKDGDSCKKTEIFRVDYNLRGVVVPPGEHNVVFDNTLL